MIWFTSDLHFGHKRVVEFCGRPYLDTEQMDRELIFAYNDLVAPDDTVYFLGDISFHKPSHGVPLIGSMNGKKILIQGNHDKYSAAQYQSVFVTVAREMRVVLNGEAFCLSHFPYAPEPRETEDPLDLRYMDRRPAQLGGTLLCGHVHTRWKTKERMINVGVDVWDYKPVSLSQILQLLCEG